MKVLTVGELKEALKDVPDDFEVQLSSDTTNDRDHDENGVYLEIYAKDPNEEDER